MNDLNIAEPSKAITFKPKFTYPIFGDSEQIFGYKGLRIDLAFDCLSMKPLLTYKYEEKLSEEIKNIEDTMGNFLPKGDYVLKSESEWLDCIEEEGFQLRKDNIVGSYERSGKTFDIYRFNLNEEVGVGADVGKKLLLRTQILTLLYIEAGSFIELGDGKWEIFVVYDRNEEEGKGIFIGFCTVYKYWSYEQDCADITESKYRGRISQVVVLPAFQGQGHGKRLYETVFDEWFNDRRCVEVTVEDPSEEFDELRDKCDLERFLKNGHHYEMRDDNDEETAKKMKLTPRQYSRIKEMAMLWMMDNVDADSESAAKRSETEKKVRLMIKRRVYLQNREGLEALGDSSMVKSKLQEVYLRVVEGYKEGAVGSVDIRKRKHV